MQTNEALYNRTIFIALRISFFALLIVWSFKIIQPFITPVLWGVIIAIAIFPFFKKFASLIGNRKKVASIIITVSALAILIVPSIIFMDSAIKELLCSDEIWNLKGSTSFILCIRMAFHW